MFFVSSIFFFLHTAWKVHMMVNAGPDILVEEATLEMEVVGGINETEGS